MTQQGIWAWENLYFLILIFLASSYPQPLDLGCLLVSLLLCWWHSALSTLPAKLKCELAALNIIHQFLLSKEFPDMLGINKLIFLSHREERAPWQSGTTGSPSVTPSLGCTNRAVLKCRPINQTPRPKEPRIDSFSTRAKSWRSKFASRWQFFSKILSSLR